MAIPELTLGISLGGWRRPSLVLALEQACQLRQQIGFGSVELWMERHFDDDGGSLWPWEFDDRIVAEIEPLLQEFPCKGAHLPFAFTNLAALNPRLREESVAQIEQGLDVCAALRMSYGVTHARYGTLGLRTLAQERELFRQSFERLGRRASEHGVVLTVENGDAVHCLDTLVDVVQPLASLGVGITLDTGHANLDGGWGSYRSGAAFVQAQAHLVKNVHLHDNCGEQDRHWPPGRGNIDFASLFAALRRAGASPLVTFEFMASMDEYARAAGLVRAWWQG